MPDPAESLVVDSVAVTRGTSTSTFELIETTIEHEKQEVIDEHHDRMGQRFKRTVDEELGISNHYTHVAVRIIHWAREFDTDLDCWQEVRCISSFSICFMLINCRPKPLIRYSAKISSLIPRLSH